MMNSSTNHLRDSQFDQWILITGAGFALLAVIIGAFAAHVLKPMLDAYSLGLVHTAARYQMYHALALLLMAVVSTSGNFSSRWLRYGALAFIVGILLFSGSLYVLALGGIKWLGAITPFGGLGFILGWWCLIVAALKPQS